VRFGRLKADPHTGQSSGSHQLAIFLPSLCGDKLPHLGHEPVRNFHKGLGWIFECRLVLGDSLRLRLSFVVRKNLADSLLIPSPGKSFLFNVLLPFRRRRGEEATSILGQGYKFFRTNAKEKR
jgi:hypothetical protein